MVERAKKEFKTVSEKTKQIGEEALVIVDKFKDNLQHYSRKELGIYAALTVALTVTLKSKKMSFCVLLLLHGLACATGIQLAFVWFVKNTFQTFRLSSNHFF